MTSSVRPYSAARSIVDGVEVIHLADRISGIEVFIAPTIGNIAYRMDVNGKNILWFPYESVGDFSRAPRLCGIPFLAPWANRLDDHAFFCDGEKYTFDQRLDNYDTDSRGYPIHGLLLFASQWNVDSLCANEEGASVRSHFEFGQHAHLMVQFPFSHTIEMTYCLSRGALEIATKINNTGTQTMPLSIGYHPYFRLYDMPRERWQLHLAADKVWSLDDRCIPTGEMEPIATVFGHDSPLVLRDLSLDHILGDLLRDEQGRSTFSVRGEEQQINIVYGSRYQASVVYAPTDHDQNFICFEPMSGITNAFNLAHLGIYKELQTVPVRETWQESFWIHPRGF